MAEESNLSDDILNKDPQVAGFEGAEKSEQNIELTDDKVAQLNDAIEAVNKKAADYQAAQAAEDREAQEQAYALHIEQMQLTLKKLREAMNIEDETEFDEETLGMIAGINELKDGKLKGMVIQVQGGSGFLLEKTNGSFAFYTGEDGQMSGQEAQVMAQMLLAQAGSDGKITVGGAKAEMRDTLVAHILALSEEAGSNVTIVNADTGKDYEIDGLIRNKANQVYLRRNPDAVSWEGVDPQDERLKELEQEQTGIDRQIEVANDQRDYIVANQRSVENHLEMAIRTAQVILQDKPELAMTSPELEFLAKGGGPVVLRIIQNASRTDELNPAHNKYKPDLAKGYEDTVTSLHDALSENQKRNNGDVKGFIRGAASIVDHTLSSLPGYQPKPGAQPAGPRPQQSRSDQQRRTSATAAGGQSPAPPSGQ